MSNDLFPWKPSSKTVDICFAFCFFGCLDRLFLLWMVSDTDVTQPHKNKKLVCLLRSVFLQPALASTTGQTMKCRFLPLLHWPLFLTPEATSIFLYSQWFRLMLKNCYFMQQIQTVQVVENLTVDDYRQGIVKQLQSYNCHTKSRSVI